MVIARLDCVIGTKFVIDDESNLQQVFYYATLVHFFSYSQLFSSNKNVSKPKARAVSSNNKILENKITSSFICLKCSE